MKNTRTLITKNTQETNTTNVYDSRKPTQKQITTFPDRSVLENDFVKLRGL